MFSYGHFFDHENIDIKFNFNVGDREEERQEEERGMTAHSWSRLVLYRENSSDNL